MNPVQDSSAPKTPKAIFTTVFVAVFLVTVLSSVVITFILPESYASTARINAEVITTNADPFAVTSEFDVILSPAVLKQVIEKLDLNTAWGRKYSNGENLNTPETLEILKARLSLMSIRNTEIIEITAYSDDPREAAQIANTVVEAYRDYRLKIAREAIVNKLEAYPFPQPVQLIDQAKPASQPSRPNKTVNIILGVAAGTIFGLIAGAFVTFVLPRLGFKTVKP
jgi:capsular polysaccharide biosynthesis protein